MRCTESRVTLKQLSDAHNSTSGVHDDKTHPRALGWRKTTKFITETTTNRNPRILGWSQRSKSQSTNSWVAKADKNLFPATPPFTDVIQNLSSCEKHKCWLETVYTYRIL
eukprot:1381532-Amphidinium_carterae.1